MKQEDSVNKILVVRETLLSLSNLLIKDDYYCPVGNTLKGIVDFIDNKEPIKIKPYDFINLEGDK